MNPILQMVKEAVSSKKFITTVAGTIAAAALKIGLDLPTEAVATILSPIVAYIIAQGWSDTGKGAAKVEAVARVVTEDNRLNTEDTVDAIKNT
jgi:hypothetical protein